ncbi:MAG: sn-glycerol-3-phosphate ABC transporter ATP-binding protein UgpC [Clostridiales Family XIII bacterium]|jgi:multiple sugar transport system ATP-binding protein|nr:sn-glycerol-3-phosphate ABC transporter ATP-binding protein UgpC [Clostridiales Family XIII bacterium]
MANVVLKDVKKIYDKNVTAVRDFSLEVNDKEFLVFVGPSGCGKSTTLRMIAGIEEITDGEIFIDGRKVNEVPAKDRDIAMVFQNYALYPHMTVYDNMAFALKLRKMPKDDIRKRVDEAATILNITGYLNRKPKALSGGERQRVAIGRAIVRHPKVFLMDEPLSNLDAKLRNQMRAELLKLRKRIDTTFIYVTHDQTEAMTLGDRIVIMKDGVIQQTGTPDEVFRLPENIFVAGFIGTPQMNFLSGELAMNELGYYVLSISGVHVPLTDKKQKLLRDNGATPGVVTAGIRPELCYVIEDSTDISGDGILTATMDVYELLGTEANLHLTIDDTPFIARIQNMESVRRDISGDQGRKIHIRPAPEWIYLFDPESGLSLLREGPQSGMSADGGNADAWA